LLQSHPSPTSLGSLGAKRRQISHFDKKFVFVKRKSDFLLLQKVKIHRKSTARSSTTPTAAAASGKT
jgi:hypothetical protein